MLREDLKTIKGIVSKKRLVRTYLLDSAEWCRPGLWYVEGPYARHWKAALPDALRDAIRGIRERRLSRAIAESVVPPWHTFLTSTSLESPQRRCSIAYLSNGGKWKLFGRSHHSGQLPGSSRTGVRRGLPAAGNAEVTGEAAPRCGMNVVRPEGRACSRYIAGVVLRPSCGRNDDQGRRSTSGSLAVMVAALKAEPHAHAASAPPASCRNVAQDRRELLEERGLVANLYALCGSFLPRLIANLVRLPLKLEGNDGLLGALIKWDLDPKNGPIDHRRIVPCLNAGFEFESVSPFLPSGLHDYWKRTVRYGRRGYEFEWLGRELKRMGLARLPASITQIYHSAAQLRLKQNSQYTISNWFALRQMRDLARFPKTLGARQP